MGTVKLSIRLDERVAKVIDDFLKKEPSLNLSSVMTIAAATWIKDPKMLTDCDFEALLNDLNMKALMSTKFKVDLELSQSDISLPPELQAKADLIKAGKFNWFERPAPPKVPPHLLTGRDDNADDDYEHSYQAAQDRLVQGRRNIAQRNQARASDSADFAEVEDC